jgi:protein tyrosine/serine phosphatase
MLWVKNMKLFGVISITVLVLLNAAYGGEISIENQPVQWAKPMHVKGVPNLHKVSDSLYRSAQPSAEGMANLKAIGIETIVNLRSFHSDRDEIGNLGLAYEHIYMKAWHPEEEDAVRFLQIVTNPKRTPVLVHCQHGADRTGTMCALYRVAVQNWKKEEALREMTQGGFGFHEIWENLPVWFEKLDIKAIKKKAGIKSNTEQMNSPDKK